MSWTTANIPDQAALITGANSGLGVHSALALAARGARVVMACRDPSRAATAAARLWALSERLTEVSWPSRPD